jgi:hypothetical protein
MRVTEGAANPRETSSCCRKTAATNLAKTPRANIERCKAAGGETKANEVSSEVRDALQGR